MTMLVVTFILLVGTPYQLDLRAFETRDLCEQAKSMLLTGSPPMAGQGQRFECVERY